jgi:P2 family phage contractile tail tube protein
MAVTTNKLYNAAIYIGGRTQIGKVKEAELPNLTQKTEEIEALALYGTPEVPVGLEAMEATLTWNGPYSDALKKLLNPFLAQQIMLRGSIDSYGPQGRIAQVPYVCTMVGRFSEVGLGSFASKTGVEQESTIKVSAIKLEIGGETLVDIDVFTGQYIVNGEDLLGQYRLNLGF